LCKRAEVQPINGASNHIEENQDSPDANSVSIEKVSCRKHYDVVKGLVEETEQTEESYMLCVSLKTLRKPAVHVIVG
jgi:hypothetical protein